jgi:hypothetical protein
MICRRKGKKNGGKSRNGRKVRICRRTGKKKGGKVGS